jgi:hypothetical protein
MILDLPAQSTAYNTHTTHTHKRRDCQNYTKIRVYNEHTVFLAIHTVVRGVCVRLQPTLPLSVVLANPTIAYSSGQLHVQALKMSFLKRAAF